MSNIITKENAILFLKYFAIGVCFVLGLFLSAYLIKMMFNLGVYFGTFLRNLYNYIC